MRSRCLLSIAMLLLTAMSLRAAQDTTDAAAELDSSSSAEAISGYMGVHLADVQKLLLTDADGALKKVEEMKATLIGSSPNEHYAKKELQKALGFLDYVKQQILDSKIPIEEFIRRLEKTPDDPKLVSQYVDRVMHAASMKVSSEPVLAVEAIENAKAFLATLRGKVKDNQGATDTIARAEEKMVRFEQRIGVQVEREKKLAALLGSPAAPLEVDAWVNGAPITDEAVKGKVVLLDFWAVWCGPCLRAFPHLREWHEKYADQGLVVIGVTEFTQDFAWDAEESGIVRSKEAVSAEDELAMLAAFAKQHDMAHVIAVESSQGLAKHYAVASIPEIVVIDRQGVVRKVKVGSGPGTAEEIEAVLVKLLAEGQEPKEVPGPVVEPADEPATEAAKEPVKELPEESIKETPEEPPAKEDPKVPAKERSGGSPPVVKEGAVR